MKASLHNVLISRGAVMFGDFTLSSGAKSDSWTGGWLRKEAKDHGIGGSWAGPDLRQNVVIVEDVVTTGVSVAKVIRRLHQAMATNGKAVAVRLVASILNRQGIKAIEGVSHVSLCTLDELRPQPSRTDRAMDVSDKLHQDEHGHWYAGPVSNNDLGKLVKEALGNL